MFPDLKRDELWSFVELKKHHKKHHEREDNLLKLLGICNEILKHAPEFPFYLIAKYDIEDLQDELAKELKDETLP